MEREKFTAADIVCLSLSVIFLMGMTVCAFVPWYKIEGEPRLLAFVYDYGASDWESVHLAFVILLFAAAAGSIAFGFIAALRGFGRVFTVASIILPVAFGIFLYVYSGRRHPDITAIPVLFAVFAAGVGIVCLTRKILSAVRRDE